MVCTVFDRVRADACVVSADYPDAGLEGLVKHDYLLSRHARELKLMQIPLTAPQLVKAIGVDRRIINNDLVHLRKHALIHRYGYWEPPNGGPAVALYVAGEGEDAPELYHRPKKRKLKPNWPTIRRDPLVAIFFGEAS